jgi:hypothetical protein
MKPNKMITRPCRTGARPAATAARIEPRAAVAAAARIWFRAIEAAARIEPRAAAAARIPPRAAVVAAAAAGVTSLVIHAAPADAATTHNWIQNAQTESVLDKSHPATATYFFNRAGSYGTGSSTSSNPITDGLKTTRVLRFTSYAQFRSDITTGIIPDKMWPAGSWVEYDNEQWSQTPAAEQRDPELYMQDFGSLAHQHGFKVFMTPARDLGNVDTACRKKSGWSNDQWYEKCHIARYAVLDGDGVVIQSQADTTSLSAFKTLVDDGKADVHAANPSAFADAELSSTYGTPGQAYAAGSSVTVSGYFINCSNTKVSWENSLLGDFKTNGY